MSEHFHGRVEDRRLITGNGRYTADFNLPGQLHAAFLRADRAHAEIRGLDTAAARRHPGVVAVYTAAELADANLAPYPILGKFEGRDGSTILRTQRPTLAADRVRYVGEQIAMVLAASAETARDAAELIQVEYRDLPVVTTVQEAMVPGAVQLHSQIPGNVCFVAETGNKEAADKAFAGAHHVTRLALESNRVVGNPMEPRAFVVSYDAATGSYRLMMPKQGLLNMRVQLAGIFNLPQEKFIIEAHDVGGSFGVRSPAYPEYVAMMVAAKRLGKPIKWVATRAECFLTDHHGRSMTVDAELALDRDGNFLATRMQFVANLGAYQSLTGAFHVVNNTAHCAVGVYKTPAHYGRAQLVHSNVTPIAAYRGAGRPDIAYVIERLVDQAAHEMGIDQAELRRRNYVPKDQFPYKTPNAATYDSGDYARGLTMAMKAADYASFAARRDDAKRRGKLRGIGVSSFIEGTGGGNFPKDQAGLTFDGEGNVTLHTLTQTQGQGHETTFPMIAAHVLGIPVERIKLKASAPESKLVGNHTGGSRSTAGQGSACYSAATRAVDLAKRYASEELGVETVNVAFADGTFSGGGKSLGLIDLAKRLAIGLPRGEPHPLDVLGEVSVANTYPNGTHIAEVEVDPQTGVVDVLRYTAVDDCGNVIDHTIVEGQLMGGITQGAGQVFGEHGIYDRETGQLLTGSFMDYVMPRAGWLRELHIEDNGVPSPTNPIGVKGVGESGTTGSLPALTNATLNALRQVGVKGIDMPLTPARVWQAIQAARAG